MLFPSAGYSGVLLLDDAPAPGNARLVPPGQTGWLAGVGTVIAGGGSLGLALSQAIADPGLRTAVQAVSGGAIACGAVIVGGAATQAVIDRRDANRAHAD